MVSVVVRLEVQVSVSEEVSRILFQYFSIVQVFEYHKALVSNDTSFFLKS